MQPTLLEKVSFPALILRGKPLIRRCTAANDLAPADDPVANGRVGIRDEDPLGIQSAVGKLRARAARCPCCMAEGFSPTAKGSLDGGLLVKVCEQWQ